MRTIIDFVKHQSLSDVKYNQLPENFADFQAAKKVYQENKTNIDNSILEIWNEVAGEIEVGVSITIPTGHYGNSGYVHSLTFIVDELTEDSKTISLIAVGHKTMH